MDGITAPCSVLPSMLSRRLSLLVAFTIALAGLGSGLAPASARADDGPEVGARAPRVTWDGVAGRVTVPDDLRGRPALLVAVDLRTHAGRELLRVVAAVVESPHRRLLEVVAVQKGPLTEATSREVSDGVDAMGVPFGVLLDADGSVAEAYGLREPGFLGLGGTWPSVFAIDARGRIRARGRGLVFLPDGSLGLPAELRDTIDRILDEAKGPYSEATLLAAARESTNPHVRDAERSLICTFADLGVEEIVQVLERGHWPSGRAVAAGLLGALGRVETADALIGAMSWDEERTVAESAAWALAELGTRDVLERLIEVVARHPDANARRLALDALRRSTDRSDLDADDLDEWRRVARRGR